MRRVPEIEQRREERRLRAHPAATLRQRQWRVLVTHQLHQARVRLANALHHAPTVEAHSQRQRVDEHPQHPLGLRPRSACGRTAPYRTPRPAAPTGAPAPATSPDADARRAHPQPARAQSQLRDADGVRAGALRPRTPVPLHVQETERRRRLVHIAEQLPENRPRAPRGSPPGAPAPRSCGTAREPAAPKLALARSRRPPRREGPTSRDPP